MSRFTAPRTRRAGLLVAALATVMLSTVATPPASATTCLDGTGTSLDPFLVASATDLAKVGSGTDGCDRDAHYLQTADITLTGDHTPIGSLGSAFTGTYDGGDFTIAGLVVDLPTTDRVGLFGNTNGATIRRVNVTGADVTGKDDAGMLVGSGSDTTIVDSSATGSVTGTDFVGGLLGYGSGALVLRSWSAGSVSGVDEVGGLIGYLPFGGIRSSFSTADVTSSGPAPSNHVGGLIGYFPGLTSTTLRVVGSATATSSKGTSIVAGDVFHWTLTLDLDEASTGGDTFTDSVDAFTMSAAPGNTGDWSPDDIVWTIAPAKALVGYHSSDQLNLQLAATSGAPDIDGVAFGDVDIAIYWDQSDLDAQSGAADLESFLGTTRPPLESAQVLFQLRDTAPSSATFTATIEADHPQEDDLVDVFARGDVTTTNSTTPDVGGLVGYIPSTAVARVYATGAVSAAGSGTDVGGLFGSDASDSMTESYWDTETSGMATSDGGTGRTTAQMTSSSTYATWPIVDGWEAYDVSADRVWGICDRVNDGYPFLLWRYDADPCTAPTVAADTPTVTCGPDAPRAGAPLTCTVSGAPAEFDFLWRAAYNPVFAEGVVTTGADGTGTLAFTVPTGATGDLLTVELVAWTEPVPIGTIAPPIPTRVDSGLGPSTVSGSLAGTPAVAGLLLALVLGAWALGPTLARSGSTGRRAGR